MEKVNSNRFGYALYCICLVVVLLLLPRSVQAYAPACEKWKRLLTQHATYQIGLNAPTSLFGAMIYKESTCDPRARNRWSGAAGLGQFMPITRQHVGQLEKALRGFDPYDPNQSLLAIIVYYQWLDTQVPVPDPCANAAMILAAYNGGIGWLGRDRRTCGKLAGCDKNQWFGNVENHSSRGRRAFNENRNYVRTVALELQPRFHEYGWGGPLLCGERR